MSKQVEAYILWLKCERCSCEFPTYVFSGENDMVTEQLRTVTNLSSKELIIFHDSDIRPEGEEIELTRVEKEKAKIGESFQEYRKRLNQNPTQYFYRCINCGYENAKVVGRLSVDELSARGFCLINKIAY